MIRKIYFVVLLALVNQVMARTTIFIHGSLLPIERTIVRAFDCPLGLHHAKKVRPRNTLSRIPHIVSKAHREQFPLEKFYIFGWSGELSFQTRRKAAHELYAGIKKNNLDKNGPLTIVCHSHAGNIALLLVTIAAEHNDTAFSIEQLVMLACPVQVATEHLITSPMFKNIYSLYIPGDMGQTIDPQWFYQESHKIAKKHNKSVPLFSKQLFPPAPNLIQAAVMHNQKNLGHNDFKHEIFMSQLPQVLLKLKEYRFTTPEQHATIFLPDLRIFPHRKRA